MSASCLSLKIYWESPLCNTVMNLGKSYRHVQESLETQLQLFCLILVYTAVANVILMVIFYSRQYYKPIRRIISINLYNISLRKRLLIFLSYRWGHEGPVQPDTLIKVSVMYQQNQALNAPWFKFACCLASKFWITVFSGGQKTLSVKGYIVNISDFVS